MDPKQNVTDPVKWSRQNGQIIHFSAETLSLLAEDTVFRENNEKVVGYERSAAKVQQDCSQKDDLTCAVHRNVIGRAGDRIRQSVSLYHLSSRDGAEERRHCPMPTIHKSTTRGHLVKLESSRVRQRRERSSFICDRRESPCEAHVDCRDK